MKNNRVFSCEGGTGMSYLSKDLILKGLENKEKVIVLDTEQDLMRSEDKYIDNKKINYSGIFIGENKLSSEQIVFEKYEKDELFQNGLILGKSGDGKGFKIKAETFWEENSKLSIVEIDENFSGKIAEVLKAQKHINSLKEI